MRLRPLEGSNGISKSPRSLSEVPGRVMLGCREKLTRLYDKEGEDEGNYVHSMMGHEPRTSPNP